MNENKKINYFIDGILAHNKGNNFIDLGKVWQSTYKKQSKIPRSTLFSRGKRSTSFFTEDSKLYITPREQELIEKGLVLNRSINGWDSLSNRILKGYIKQTKQKKEESFLYKKLLERYKDFNDGLSISSRSFVEKFSVVRLWNFSIIAAIIFGMFTMTMIYRYLGQGVSAGSVDSELVAQEEKDSLPAILTEVEMSSDNKAEDDDNAEYIERVIQNLEKSEKRELEKEITKMVEGYPIEKMVPYIMEQDKIVVAFLIGIAKKESNWGERVPVLNGQDCYNYWGYRGQRRLMGSGGHTCFNSRKDAVDTVAKRIAFLVSNEKLNTPEKMSVWKCGYDCSWDSPVAVKKWISDVSMYFDKLNTD